MVPDPDSQVSKMTKDSSNTMQEKQKQGHDASQTGESIPKVLDQSRQTLLLKVSMRTAGRGSQLTLSLQLTPEPWISLAKRAF